MTNPDAVTLAESVSKSTPRRVDVVNYSKESMATIDQAIAIEQVGSFVRVTASNNEEVLLSKTDIFCINIEY